jgi:hypothetical protein
MKILSASLAVGQKNELPKHFFASGDGSLCDTRQKDWSKKPIREVFSFTFREIKNTQQLKATLRNGAFAWPGGYPLYFVTSDGGILSFEAFKDKFVLRSVLDSIKNYSKDGWRVVGCDVNWEDADLYCDHTNERIPSAYAEK